VGDEGLLRTFLDAGVNYIDTSEGYRFNERVLGKAMENLDRKSLFITSKVMAYTGYTQISQLGPTKEGFLKKAYRILESLRTDYLDCLMIAEPESVEMLKNEGFHAATEQLKKEGRINFVGVSLHGSEVWGAPSKDSMEKIFLAAAEEGTSIEEVGRRIEKKVENAQEFIKRHNLKSDKEIKDAAIRFVLSNPNVHTVLYTLQNYSEAREFLKLSGSRLASRDKELLASYSRECGSLYCRHACGLCEQACPQHVPVNTIMRYDHYFVAQGREKHAMAEYAALRSTKADICQNCSGHCESACPYGVPVQVLLATAHQTLSLT